MTKRAPRTAALAAATCSLLCVFLARPASADPPTTSIPDAGSRPVASAPLAPPTGGGVPAPPVTSGPLADRVAAETSAVELIGERLKQAGLDVQQAHQS